MIKHICDRCKQEIPSVLPFATCVFPIVNINITELGFDNREIDLCDSCKNEFFNWFAKVDAND